MVLFSGLSGDNLGQQTAASAGIPEKIAKPTARWTEVSRARYSA
jgi:hypothetical protein